MSQTFDAFSLAPAVRRGLATLGFETPTPVQAATIPLVLEGRDALVQAKTGSGKTLAFGLPLLTMLSPQPRPQALIVVPTRELAVQVHAAIASLQTHDASLRVLPVFGGVSVGPQETALRRGTDVVVGTPGRLKDLLDRRSLDLSKVRVLILDEADQMLDMGFRPDIEFLMRQLPARQQTLLFSATMPAPIEAIARQYMKQPAVIKLVAAAEATPVEIEHQFLRVPADRRIDALVALLKAEAPERALVFTRMKHETRKLATKLAAQTDLTVGFLNGNMSQNARNTALAGFRSGALRVLVATDVAARGLDVEDLSHVFHFAIPDVVETYIHRSGRTGRAGKEGRTITLVTPDSEAEFAAIRRRITFTELSMNLEDLPKAATQLEDSARRAPAPRSQRRPQTPSPRSASPDPKPRTAAAPRKDEATAPRRFRLPLLPGHRTTTADLQQWLIGRTGLPTTAIRIVALHPDHALIEVPVAHAEHFKHELKRQSKAR